MNIDNKVLKYNRHIEMKPSIKRFTDCLKVKMFMKLNGTIDRYNASKIGVGRLAARIYDLKNKHNTPVDDFWSQCGTYKIYKLGEKL